MREKVIKAMAPQKNNAVFRMSATAPKMQEPHDVNAKLVQTLQSGVHA